MTQQRQVLRIERPDSLVVCPSVIQRDLTHWLSVRA